MTIKFKSCTIIYTKYRVKVTHILRQTILQRRIPSFYKFRNTAVTSARGVKEATGVNAPFHSAHKNLSITFIVLC